jgi:hypothetical protein
MKKDYTVHRVGEIYASETDKQAKKKAKATTPTTRITDEG